MRTQTVAEFLASGGKITRVPAKEPEIKSEGIKSNTNGGIASIISMEDADLYHGEKKKSKAKAKAIKTIDVSALPEELRIKYVDEVINGSNEENDSEED